MTEILHYMNTTDIDLNTVFFAVMFAQPLWLITMLIAFSRGVRVSVTILLVFVSIICLLLAAAGFYLLYQGFLFSLEHRIYNGKFGILVFFREYFAVGLAFGTLFGVHSVWKQQSIHNNQLPRKDKLEAFYLPFMAVSFVWPIILFGVFVSKVVQGMNNLVERLPPNG